MNTNKKIKKSVICTACLIGGVILLNTTKSNQETDINSYLQLYNIEALASNEGGSHSCYNSGSVDCNGRKVEIKISAFSLLLDK